jgi:hypothetical protein
MMAMSEEQHEGRGSLKNVALSALLVLLLLLAGPVTGILAWAIISGQASSVEAMLFLASALLVGVASVWGLVRLKVFSSSKDPVSPKTRKANNLLMLSGLLGGVMGAAMALSMISADEPLALFSNSPMPPAVVIPALAVWLLIVPVISWQWHRNIDEHETEAYKSGGIAAIYLYLFLTPAWWFAWRGGLVPAPATMVIYMLVIGVFTIGWFWRRYR